MSCWPRACRSSPRLRCDERSGRRLGFKSLGRRRLQSLARRHCGLDRDLHGGARHRNRQRFASLHCRQPRRQRRRKHLGRHHTSDRQCRGAIVELRLLARRQFGMAFFVMLMVGAILFGSNQIMPQLLQTAFPYTAMLSGLAMMPGGLAMLVLMPVAGQVTGRFQPKYLMTLGLIGIALSMWYSTTLTPNASFDYFALVRIFQMIGLPFLFIPINTVAYDGLPPDK